MRSSLFVLLLTIGAVGLLSDPSLAADKPFEIQVVDEETGRGVPLVELETVNNIVYLTDSQGLAAIDEPGLFERKVFFHVRSHGYQFKKDGFGYAGTAVEMTPGGSATLKIKRINIAQRLYRVTGGGIYRDSVILGHDAPIEHPLLNAQVLGSDSVENTVYKGEVRWFWGDTNQVKYPLGTFDVPGATSKLPSEGGLDPDVGVDLTFFVGENGFAKPTADMPGDGPTWITGLVTLTDDDGRERMFANYVKIKPPLTTYARGLVEWSDDDQQFEKIADVDLDATVLPSGHPVKHKTGDVEHVYFASPFPLVRVRSNPKSYLNLDEYESFTCLAEGGTLDDPRFDRGSDGKLRYSWKRNTPPVDVADQKKLLEKGVLKEGEGLLALKDVGTGKTVLAHGGSVYWNEHRKRWVMIFVESFGKPSFLGEVWYAEADSLVGPWVYTVKIATHDRYDFYNPKQHPMFDKDGGKTIFFEGTYTNTFSGNPVKTPRYDYNQMMYKLDLEDERLVLPVAIYRNDDGRFAAHADGDQVRSDRLAFFALDRAAEGTLPIHADDDGRLMTAHSDDREPNFHALPADAKDPPAATQPLYEFVNSATGERTYAIDEDSQPAGFERQAQPICLVWTNPLRCTWDAGR